MKSSAELPAALKAIKTLQKLQKKQLICNTDKHYSLLAAKMRKIAKKKEFKARKLISPAGVSTSRIRKASTTVDNSSFPLDLPWKPQLNGQLWEEKRNNPLYCTLFSILLS